MLLCFGSVGCNADEEFNGGEEMDQKIVETDDKGPISVDTDATPDGWTADIKSLVEEEFEFETPMPVLESVDEVLLTPEEEQLAMEQAEDKEKYTKTPRGPKKPPSKE